MRVYVLVAFYGHSDYTEVLGVYDKPKTARVAVDNRVNHSTKNKWSKTKKGSRYYKYSGTTYAIAEYKVITAKE